MTNWDRRIERARELEVQYPAAAELLRFYREIAAFQRDGRADRAALIDLARRKGPPSFAADSDAARAFFDQVLKQMRGACGASHAAPVAAVLRPEGEGGKRTLLCSDCLTEWEFRRLVCPACGEEDHAKLPVFTAEEFPHIRIEACDTCRHYIKAIDLTRNGLAVPEVDEIASVSLDLWAAEKGYTKMQTNLFGL
jgi:formate dehydrogenase accessory protein FdhE